MKDYRPAVEAALRSIDCSPVEHLRNGIWRWYSPKTERYFSVDKTIPTRGMANKVLKEAGHGPLYP